MQITITDGGDLRDPKNRILAVEAAAKAICDQVGADPADGTMMLLTAAVHIAARHSRRPVKDVALVLAESLGAAIVAADGFFTLRHVSSSPSSTEKKP